MAFHFHTAELAGVVRIVPDVFRDARGFLLEAYRKDLFAAAGMDVEFVQDNQSCSARDVVRALHFQVPPMAQAKLIRVVSGAIFDVVVDLRPGSPTFARWAGQWLSDDDHEMIYVPEGFAHGFAALQDSTHVEYKVTRPYSPAHDRGLAWDDPDLGIRWPVERPLLSPRDRAHPRLKDLPPVEAWRVAPP